MGKYKTNNERIAQIEHAINGRGYRNTRTIKELRKALRELKRIIRMAIAIAIFFFGERLYELLKHVL